MLRKKNTAKRKVEYKLLDNGQFEINNYDLAKPFASFFPGVAGLYGIPLWIFYVNRAQGIVSFGTQDKDHAIMEFFPANRAWQIVSTQGFRTFLKIKSRNREIFYEPFQNSLYGNNFVCKRKMMISSYDLNLEEENLTLGLKVNVDYYSLSNEPLACLIRKVTLKNTSGKTKTLEILDGMPCLIPYGVNNKFLKKLSRTIEAWMQVNFVGEFKVPFYKLVVDPTDRPQVSYIKGGNFYYQFYIKNGKAKDSKFIVDPACIFENINDFSYPQRFLTNSSAIDKNQATRNKTPSAFGFSKISLKPKEEVTLISLIGYAQDESHLTNFVQQAKNNVYLEEKYEESRKIIGQLQNNIFTASANNTYNLYCQQTYLDNILRGGFPLSLKAKDRSFIFHVYSRKHGDLERDYNKFLTATTYFSQGNGNYRDVNQNRRNDVWFNPEVKDDNLVCFFNFIQLDGFNPLVVMGVQVKLQDNKIPQNLIENLLKKKEDFPAVLDFLKKSFEPGQLFIFLEERRIDLKVSPEEFLLTVLAYCEKHDNAVHGDGFWIDHWTYNTDALEAYLAIYPENLKDLLFHKNVFVFYNNFVKVKQRDKKYVLFEDRARQYHAVTAEELDDEQETHTQALNSEAWAVRSDFGKGQVYKTTLIVKICCLIANKITSLDPSGVGMEMEANKPGWYDALNGLPGLFGSSVCETMELKRLIDFVLNAISQLKLKPEFSISMPEELYDFLLKTEQLIDEYFRTDKSNKDFIYWDKSYQEKEAYRERVKLGISGKDKNLKFDFIRDILNKINKKLELSVARAKDLKTSLYHTYFINEVKEFEKIKDAQNNTNFKLSKDGLCYIKPTRFEQVALPLFLEAQVHALRLITDKTAAKTIYEKAKSSLLYDKILKMFKVNAPLETVSEEIGRARVFTPGWLENGSIWLHMAYKFILELLRNGLYDEFFTEFKDGLIPFQPAQRYGRSILENSSFLVSSDYPEKSLWGNGFVARLSGSTAEFINIWLWMNAGKNPFRLGPDGKLLLKFEPVLPANLFSTKKEVFPYYCANGEKISLELPKNSYAFNFLGRILIIYHNLNRLNTFGRNAARFKKIRLFDKEGKIVQIEGEIIHSPYAEKIRNREYLRIEIDLGSSC